MARSRRKPWLKDKGLTTREYWKPIRHNWKQHLRQNYLDPDLIFESPKTYINDWDYCDWRYYVEEDEEPYIMANGKVIWVGWNKSHVEKYSRK